MRQPCELILTAPPEADLAAFVRRLVEQRLCAAGHTGPITTSYRWRGEVRTVTEDKAVLHTCTDRIDDVTAAIEAWHPYELPYLAQQPLVTSDAYAQWVREQASP